MGTVVITGGTRGLGLRAIRHVAETGSYDIVLVGRGWDEVSAVASGLRERTRNRVATVPMDVSSLASVRAGAEEIRRLIAARGISPIAALMLNAGVQFSSGVRLTTDGFETTFATNCLGPFLLVNLLLDEIENGGRIVWTASGTHDPSTIDGKLVGVAAAPDADMLATTGRHGKPLAGGVRYTTSKLCTILYSYELQRRLDGTGRPLISVAYDPGYVPETGLTRSRSGLERWVSRTGAFKWLFGALGGAVGSLEFSGRGLGQVAVDPAYAGSGGKFIQSRSGKLLDVRSSSMSYDATLATALWGASERLTGIQ